MRKLTLTFFAALLTLLPTEVVAIVEVTAEDTVAGLGTSVKIRGVEQTPATLVITPPYGPEMTVELAKVGENTVTLPGNELTIAGEYVATVEDATSTTSPIQFTVLPESVDPQSAVLQAERETLTADGEDRVFVSMILRDRYGNPLSGRPVRVISSRSADSVAEITAETDSEGEQRFSVSTTLSGTPTLRAIDLLSGKTLGTELVLTAQLPGNAVGGNSYTHNPSTYNTSRHQPFHGGTQLYGSVAGRSLFAQTTPFDRVAQFRLETAGEMRVNIYDDLTITALDANGNIVEDYTGTIQLASTDQYAVLPSFGEVTFRGADLGRKTLVQGLRFATPGQQILYAEDSNDPNVNGQANVNIMGGQGATEPEQVITITRPLQNARVSGPEVILEGNGSPFINLIITGGKEDVFGETDENGNFSVLVPLNMSQADHTLRVRDQSGFYDSGNLLLKLDTKAPTIEELSYTPQIPRAGHDVLFTTKLELEEGESIEEITLTVNEEQYYLESGGGSGTYQVVFSLEEDGQYTPVLTVIDDAGNVQETHTSLTVRQRGLPPVTNLRATPGVGRITLEWDPLILDENDEPITGYRIYVGESAENFPYTYEVDASKTTAVIGNVPPGVPHVFAATALSGDEESRSKSNIAEASAKGVQLVVEPGNGNLHLTWEGLEDIPLNSYTIEYGVEPGVFSEERMLPGTITVYSLDNLLNGVTYYLRITPIATTGEILEEYIMAGEAAPRSNLGGFQPEQADPVPAGLLHSPGGTFNEDAFPPTHQAAPPEQPTTGIPFSPWMGALIAGVLALMHAQRRRRLYSTSKFLRTMNLAYAGEQHRLHK